MMHDTRRHSTQLGLCPGIQMLHHKSYYQSDFSLSCLREERRTSKALQDCCPTQIGAPPSSPLAAGKAALERRRGAWRDAGFWMRIISPGGTKHLQRRGSTNNNNIIANKNDKNTLLSMKSGTLPRGLKYSPTACAAPASPVAASTHTLDQSPGLLTPPAEFRTPVSRRERRLSVDARRGSASYSSPRSLDLEQESGYCSEVWDGSPVSSRSSQESELEGTFQRLSARSRTLPRDLRSPSPETFLYLGRAPSPPPGTGDRRRSKSPTSPWWWRMSPSMLVRRFSPSPTLRKRSPSLAIRRFLTERRNNGAPSVTTPEALTTATPTSTLTPTQSTSSGSPPDIVIEMVRIQK